MLPEEMISGAYWVELNSRTCDTLRGANSPSSVAGHPKRRRVLGPLTFHPTVRLTSAQYDLINKDGGGRGPVAPPVFKMYSAGYDRSCEPTQDSRWADISPLRLSRVKL